MVNPKNENQKNKHLFESNYSLEDIEHIAATVWNIGNDFRVWCFEGAMGAGKTHFVKALCKHLGVQDKVSSPTYAIIQEYEANYNNKHFTIYHSDWYRLEDSIEVQEAGAAEILYHNNNYAFIEWAQRAQDLFIKDYLLIKLNTISTLERHIALWHISTSKE